MTELTNAPSDQASMPPFHSETVRLPAGRPVSAAAAGVDHGDEPVVLRFPERGRLDRRDTEAQADKPLWIHGYRGKRSFDIAAGSLLALALMPVAFLVGSILLFFSGGPVLDRTAAVGHDGRNFPRLRFWPRGRLRRSESLGQEDEGSQQILPLFEAESVPRTRFGRFLHDTGLERLPELWNVLRGDLALIGPAARTSDDNEEASPSHPRWEIKPGFVWVSRPEAEDEAVMRYVATQGIWTDLKILASAGWRLLGRAFRREAVAGG